MQVYVVSLANNIELCLPRKVLAVAKGQMREASEARQRVQRQKCESRNWK